MANIPPLPDYLLAAPDSPTRRSSEISPGYATAGLGILACLTPGHSLDLTFNLGIVRSGLDFLIGASLSLIFTNCRTSAVFDLAAATFAGSATFLAVSGAEDFWIASLLGPLIICVAFSNSLIERFFSCGPLVWLGRISYSSYMLQKFVLDRLTEGGFEIINYGRLATGFGLVTCIAAVSYIWIEQPARAALDCLMKRLIAAGWTGPAETVN